MERLQVLPPKAFLIFSIYKSAPADDREAIEIIMRAVMSEEEPDWWSMPDTVRESWRRAWDTELNKY